MPVINGDLGSAHPQALPGDLTWVTDSGFADNDPSLLPAQTRRGSLRPVDESQSDER